MLVRIRPQDAKLGMYVHAFEGRWSDRPFWQSQFVLSTAEDLARVQRSVIEAVIIDTAKGARTVVPVAAPRAASGTTAPPHAAPRPAIARSPVAEAAAKRPELRLVGAPPRRMPVDPHLRGLLQTVSRARREVMRLFEDGRLGRPLQVARLVPVVDQLAAELERDAGALLAILRIKSREDYAYLHSVAVSVLMMNLARTLRLRGEPLAAIGMAGLVHDIGKLALPAELLGRAGPLDDGEMAIVRRHPELGARILRRLQDMPKIAFDVCLHHHERVDGKGYPFGRSGDHLSTPARMGAICDVYDALTSHRPYRDAWSPQKALAEMQRSAGQFDPDILRAFITSLGIFPRGSLVRVRDSALGIVVADNPAEPTRPTVRTFYSIPTMRRMYCEDVVVGSSAILTLERPEDWALGDWPALARELMAPTALH